MQAVKWRQGHTTARCGDKTPKHKDMLANQEPEEKGKRLNNNINGALYVQYVHVDKA